MFQLLYYGEERFYAISIYLRLCLYNVVVNAPSVVSTKGLGSSSARQHYFFTQEPNIISIFNN